LDSKVLKRLTCSPGAERFGSPTADSRFDADPPNTINPATWIGLELGGLDSLQPGSTEHEPRRV